MDLTEARLRENYSRLDTDELAELRSRDTLTDTAYKVLDELLAEKGVTPSDISRYEVSRKIEEAQKKDSAASAVQWALGLSVGYVLGPIIVFSLASGTGVSGGFVAEKLIVGIAWFFIIYFGLRLWGTFQRKTQFRVQAIQPAETTPKIAVAAQENISSESAPPARAGKWNYIGIGVGLFMLLFLFLPQLIRGTFENQYLLGVIFWVGVIIYCLHNISKAKRQPSGDPQR